MGGYHTKTGTEIGHQTYLDILRMLATVFVVGIHTVSLAASLAPVPSAAYRILTMFVFVFLSCNLLFLMISGALLLPVKGESVRVFFFRRFVKVAVPLVVYYILYVCAKEGISTVYPKNLPRLFVRILSGAPEEAPHFWLVYVILILYLLTPFLRYLVQHISDSVFYGTLLVVCLTAGYTTYAPMFGIDSKLSVITDSYVAAFLLGYFLSAKCSKKFGNVLIFLGSLSCLATCGLIWFTSGYEPYIYGNAPTMLLFSAAIFLLVKNGRYQKISPLWLRIICRHSYSILLIHWGVLHFVVKQTLHINVLGGAIVGGCIAMFSLTFLLSLAGAVLLDKILFEPIGKVLNRCFGSYSKNKQ